MDSNKFKSGLKSVVIAALISIGIGTVFLLMGNGNTRISFSHFLRNSGYSVCLGLGLFANGLIFRFVENRYISWVKAPVKSLLVAIAVHLTYSTVVIFFFNWLWFIVIYNQSISAFLQYGWNIIIGEYIVLIMITSIMYAKSFFKDYRDEAIQGERLKQEAISLQYQVLQNQVSPHFLFNSLNILGSLIDLDQEKAKKYTRELSLFYRELIDIKDKELIPLSEEISFVRKYIYLQKIRFGNNFDVEIFLNDNPEGEVIPMSLQMLLENAVKHNIISGENPLRVIIGKLDTGELFVENNLQTKSPVEGSNKTGLKNLRERYQFLTNKEMEIKQNDKFFRVTIPLIKLET